VSGALRARLRQALPHTFVIAFRHFRESTRHFKTRTVTAVIGLLQGLSNVLHRSRAAHLVLCGCPRSGTSLLYTMMRTSAGHAAFAPPNEASARSTRRRFSRRLITKRPLDVFEVQQIVSELGGFRNLFFLLSIRDPRDLVSSRHPSVPNQFFQGVDYQFFISRDALSLSKPGIAACFDAIRAVGKMPNLQVLSVRYEELTREPEKLRQVLNDLTRMPFARPFSDFARDEVPPSLAVAMNGVRPVQTSASPAWLQGDRLARACRQTRLFPVLEDIAKAWGYPGLEETVRSAGLAIPELPEPRGTIVAFHTDDALYRSEATRFQRSVERLGLPLDMTVCPTRDHWLKNTAMKPQIIADARHRLRGPLLYVDVDAFVHHDPWPYLGLYDGDLAFHVTQRGEVLSGTILVNDTVGAKNILDQWETRLRSNPMTSDQKALGDIVAQAEASTEVAAQRLPVNLTYIFDKQPGYLLGPIYIEHLQASRDCDRKPGNKTRSDGRLRRIAELELWEG
jgi:hypothetical protein